MKQYRFSEHDNLLNTISYTKPKELKPLIKFVLTSDNITADVTELCILSDLKTILGLYDSSKDLKILTFRQKRVIIEHVVNDKTQAELAEELHITQQGVSILLCSGLKRIKDYIIDGSLKWVPWTDEEKQVLMAKYGKVAIYKLSKELGRPESKVVSMYHYLNNKAKQEQKLCK